MSGQGLPLAPDVQIQVLHMVQEALSNVRKHARASHVELRVGRHPWRFEVCDDGCGFVPADVAPDSLHVGLGIMRERALLVHALVHVQSRPGAGTRVLIELPPSASAGASVPPPAQAPPVNA
jgi:two-component system nitrate/nitrite sensor histidine kinase NarX